MGSLVRRAAAVVAASAVACALGVTGVAAAGAATQARRRAGAESLATAHGLAVPGANLWIQRYNDPGNGADAASSVAVSPSGSRVFVTGASAGATPQGDYVTRRPDIRWNAGGRDVIA